MLLLFVSLLTNLKAEVVKVTLTTAEGDNVVVGYDVSRLGNQVKVRFTSQKIVLGKASRGKYKNASKVVVMFFDRTGNYERGISISNMVPDAFMVPSNASYKPSSNGFYLVQDSPELCFVVKENEATSLSVPIYLAYRPRRDRYYVFGKCTSLDIPLVVSEHIDSQRGAEQVSQSVSELPAGVGVEDADVVAPAKVRESIRLAEALIADTKKLPFSETLMDEIQYLRQTKREIADVELLTKISGVLGEYEDKKLLLEERAAAAEQAAIREAEMKAQDEAAALKAQNEAIAAEQQAKAEREEKRKTTMIVVGAILAVIAFIAKQVIQYLRDAKSQKKLEDMQHSMASQAEAEAKKRAKDTTQGKLSQIAQKPVGKAKHPLHKDTTIKINGKTKKLSI